MDIGAAKKMDCEFDEEIDLSLLAYVSLPPVVIVLLYVFVAWIVRIWDNMRLDAEWYAD